MSDKLRWQALHAQGLLRRFEPIAKRNVRTSMVTIRGRDAVMFCSSDYLGLSQHPDVVNAGARAMMEHGTGTGGSRFIGGNSVEHDRLEKALALFHGKEDAVFFSGGFAANLGGVSGIGGPDDVIFSDERNHASIIEGCRTSKARVVVWRHNDYDDLDHLLASTPCRGQRVVVCESLYSMDGDFSDLPTVCAVCDRHEALLYVDEVHALGVFGPGGRGMVALDGLEQRVDVIMAGAGKGLGCIGGYLATSARWCEVLRSSSKPFVFTTSVPVHVAAALCAALEQMVAADALREAIFTNAGLMRQRLTDEGFNFLSSPSHIFPVITGDPTTTEHVEEQLLLRGFYAKGIKPPSVKPGSCRLRVTVSPFHTEEQIDGLVSALVAIRNMHRGFRQAANAA